MFPGKLSMSAWSTRRSFSTAARSSTRASITTSQATRVAGSGDLTRKSSAPEARASVTCCGSSSPTRATTRQARFQGRFRTIRLTARAAVGGGPVEDQEVERPGEGDGTRLLGGRAHRQIVAARGEYRRQGMPDAGVGFEEEGLHGAGPGIITLTQFGPGMGRSPVSSANHTHCFYVEPGQGPRSGVPG